MREVTSRRNAPSLIGAPLPDGIDECFGVGHRNIRKYPMAQVGDVGLAAKGSKHVVGPLSNERWTGIKPAWVEVALQGHLSCRQTPPGICGVRLPVHPDHVCAGGTGDLLQRPARSRTEDDYRCSSGSAYLDGFA